MCLDAQPWCVAAQLDGSWTSYAQPSSVVIIVALRAIEDEEVWVDYRWDARGCDLPDWYEPIANIL